MTAKPNSVQPRGPAPALPIGAHWAEGLVLGASVLVLSGCWSTDGWDKEYSCRGQERSTTQLQGHPSSENYEKVYASEIDFHIRSGAILVKSHQAPLRQEADKRIAFQTNGGDSSASGNFDETSGALTMQETRHLVVDGTPQEVRISGTYQCKPV